MRGISVVELMAGPAMAPYASAADGTSAVMFGVSHGVLWVYMVIVSVARYIINAEKAKCTIYHFGQLLSYFDNFIITDFHSNCMAELQHYTVVSAKHLTEYSTEPNLLCNTNLMCKAELSCQLCPLKQLRLQQRTI